MYFQTALSSAQAAQQLRVMRLWRAAYRRIRQSNGQRTTQTTHLQPHQRTGTLRNRLLQPQTARSQKCPSISQKSEARRQILRSALQPTTAENRTHKILQTPLSLPPR